MFRRILIPFPPDTPDTSVASYGLELAGSFDAEVVVLSVLDRPQQRDQIRADEESEAREATDPILELAEDRAISAEQLIRDGPAGEEIVATIVDEEIDLVVMGTHARTGVDRVVLGSVTEAVIRDSPVPVLTVTPEAEMPMDPPTGDGR